MGNRLLLLFISVLVASCNNGDNRKSDETYLGGEIVNPRMRTVIIYKDDTVLDTVTLAEDNTFLYKFENAEEGLYTFHHNELQWFYLTPSDSLMLRLNTLEFDESLHFSGTGDKENNFLINIFLDNEEDSKTLSNFFMLPPDEFQQKLDSISSLNQTKLKKFIAMHKPNKQFREVAERILSYNKYIKKEFYTSVLHKSKDRVSETVFPKDFYNYREHIDLDGTQLQDHYSRIRFLDAYFSNLVYSSSQDSEVMDNRSYTHIYNKIEMMDSLLSNEFIKERLVKRNTRRYLLSAKEVTNEEKMVALAKNVLKSPENIAQIEALAQATMKLTPGQNVPNVALVNTENETVELPEIIDKKSVLYFWSLESVKHYKDIHSKAAELSSKFPEYRFIGINTDTHYKKWLKTVKGSGYSLDNEFQINDIQKAETSLVLNSHFKAVIVDEQGIILESNTNLFRTEIEEQLLAYLNQ
ncbi:hypothetical protein [Marinirhabdus gelatinilytica]|uniref:Thioredoxin domain-containing protein n=1 Tax=Marinirhabdus gelatinilytica TaxID=1703343 RepID=A0A370QAQ1_9FLAO|nr:hypothetical protein [Marinirhabdus gelatinilytica]RDK85437.1 hypothetical protein C8D94_103262 [Marinirhabdus gelatinilytica]